MTTPLTWRERLQAKEEGAYIFTIPAHVLLLRDMAKSRRALYSSPNIIDGEVVGEAVREPSAEEGEAATYCMGRGLLARKRAAVPGEAHPFEEAEVLTISSEALRLVAAYREVGSGR